MANLAIIPARGGSKRVPRKNIKSFLGEPIISYSIRTAIASGLFDEIMVSTDDEEIAKIALENGAKVPFMRSSENSSDFASTLSVIKEVVHRYKEQSVHFDLACCIYATSPLTHADRLKEGLEKLIGHDYISVFPVVPYSYPVWRGLEIDEKETIRMVWPEYQNSRSQDLKKVYHDAGQWYWLNCHKIGDVIYTTNSGAVILNQLEVQDIDNFDDWEIAELKYKVLNSIK